MIRVLIVDDSTTVRKIVVDCLRAGGIDVIGEAASGSEAVTLTRRLRPDVVLMDVVMPDGDGLAATRQIMAEIPTPIVILSGHANRQEVFKTYDALAAGALEVCAKPTRGGEESRMAWRNILCIVRAASQVRVTKLSQHASRPDARSMRAAGLPVGANPPKSEWGVVAIGASTGGPVAVREILRNLPPDFPLPILVAIHCSRQLPTSIAGWLDRECLLKVSDAQNGERLPDRPGTVIVAPPGRNLRISGGRTVLSDAGDESAYVPSIDELFTAAAESLGKATIGVLLTGMGADGARGLKQIRDRGGCTIAEDEASCVVFGMPAAAIELGAVEHVTPLHRIPWLLARLAGSSPRTPGPTGAGS